MSHIFGIWVMVAMGHRPITFKFSMRKKLISCVNLSSSRQQKLIENVALILEVNITIIPGCWYLSFLKTQDGKKKLCNARAALLANTNVIRVRKQ